MSELRRNPLRRGLFARTLVSGLCVFSAVTVLTTILTDVAAGLLLGVAALLVLVVWRNATVRIPAGYAIGSDGFTLDFGPLHASPRTVSAPWNTVLQLGYGAGSPTTYVVLFCTSRGRICSTMDEQVRREAAANRSYAPRVQITHEELGRFASRLPPSAPWSPTQRAPWSVPSQHMP